MLTYEQRRQLPTLAAQVTQLDSGARLELDGRDAVLTLPAGIRKTKRDRVIALVAASLDDFRLATPGDPEPAPVPAEFLETHRRGNHHLAHAFANFR